ncbi:AMP-binding protein [Porphyromonas pogonae]|uniref:AMP-binding protein n=1 Tax=Porphyromonas pogonae TaxID=867595 RepID=UPI002E75D7A0|nr:AMP-binding protein [Porphyromonas pogonae]
MIEKNFISLIEESIQQHWTSYALTNYTEGNSYTFGDVAKEIARRHEIYAHAGVQPGDKIALMGKDTAEWCIGFLSIVTYGAIIVPILQDFPVNDAESIITHSEAKILMVSTNIWAQMKSENMPGVTASIDIQTGQTLMDKTPNQKLSLAISEKDKFFAEKYPNGLNPADINYHKTPNSEIVLINYTSGTTGFSKGVMITGNNLAGNVTFAVSKKILLEGDPIICFLPLAHMYSCAFNFLLPIAAGAHIYLLGKIPAPHVLTTAFKKVKPKLIISVPLVMEKIYQKSILPKIQDSKVKLLLQLPFFSSIIRKKIRKELMKGLGGEFRQMIIGGAPLSKEVGEFLYDINFPFTVGYGMTECAPLITYSYWEEWKLGSCGKALPGIMEVRINYEENTTSMKDVGEIQVRGENVCLGYFKNPEQTANLFTDDGWMKTGDLGYVDAQGYLFIKGRSKTMLLGANGQNIYPEEIESKINNNAFILENVVVSRNGKLTAIIVPDQKAIMEAGLTMEQAWDEIERFRAHLNEQLGSYEKIIRFERRDVEFEKTPKQSIKRFLYN